MPAAYRLADEPRPSAVSNLAVNPFWPLLAVMLGGAWLSWPWFLVNSIAVGSPTRSREIVWILVGFVGAVVAIFGIYALRSQGIISEAGLPYALLALTVWKLGVSYWLYVLQQRTFGIWEYYGGVARNGFLIAVLGMFLGRRLLQFMAEADPLLALIAVAIR
jgi:hypothetical protein